MLLHRAAVVGVVVALLCLVLTGVVWWQAEPEAPAPGEEKSPLTPAQVLREWDTSRSAAWAAGDVEGLRGLYANGSAVGRRDVKMLHSYVARGLVVEGLTTQLLTVEEVDLDDDRWILEVTDRVHSGTVVGEGVRRALPQDRPSRRRLTLVRRGADWRVAQVVAVQSEASGRQRG